MLKLFICSSHSDWNSFGPTFLSNELKAGCARSSRSGRCCVGDFFEIPRIDCINATRCQYVAVVLSNSCRHFNHTAVWTTSLDLAWGVKCCDCSSVCIQLFRAWAALASAELPLCRFSHQIYWSFSCWCSLHSSRVQQIIHASKNEKMDKYLFSCSTVSSAGHIWAGGQGKQMHQQGSAAVSSWSPGETELLRRKKKNNKTLLGTQGKGWGMNY